MSGHFDGLGIMCTRIVLRTTSFHHMSESSIEQRQLLHTRGHEDCKKKGKRKRVIKKIRNTFTVVGVYEFVSGARTRFAPI